MEFILCLVHFELDKLIAFINSLIPGYVEIGKNEDDSIFSPSFSSNDTFQSRADASTLNSNTYAETCHVLKLRGSGLRKLKILAFTVPEPSQRVLLTHGTRTNATH